jgi:hypothetical protein
MGNHTSNANTNTCLICWENVDTEELCKCIQCNIILHNECEEKYRSEKKYCECPHCRRIGTIGFLRH